MGTGSPSPRRSWRFLGVLAGPSAHCVTPHGFSPGLTVLSPPHRGHSFLAGSDWQQLLPGRLWSAEDKGIRRNSGLQSPRQQPREHFQASAGAPGAAVLYRAVFHCRVTSGASLEIGVCCLTVSKGRKPRCGSGASSASHLTG